MYKQYRDQNKYNKMYLKRNSLPFKEDNSVKTFFLHSKKGPTRNDRPAVRSELFYLFFFFFFFFSREITGQNFISV